jgi:hypothetical protein
MNIDPDTTVEKIEGPIPFLMNLGQPESIIGWTQIFRKEDGKIRMIVDLGPDGSTLLGHFTDIAELKGIGFAGVMRRPRESSDG